MTASHQPSPCTTSTTRIHQREESLNGSWDRDIKYWAKTLENIPETLPILLLLDAQPRKVLEDYNFHRPTLRLNSSLSAQINQTSRNMRVTPFQFCLSAFRVLLRILGGIKDFCIGIGDANRTSEDMPTSIGALVNILPFLFTGHLERTSFADILQDTCKNDLSALSHSRVPFGAILESLFYYTLRVSQSYFPDFRRLPRDGEQDH
jgi:hybrid polyketide synthase/nonribosomal peptide synthetase ACE1